LLPWPCPLTVPERRERVTKAPKTTHKMTLQCERHSGGRQKLFAFSLESRSRSERNAVRNHNGMVFGFRLESRSPLIGFPRKDANRAVGEASLPGCGDNGPEVSGGGKEGHAFWFAISTVVLAGRR
jgi:hypothetical protein